MLQKNCFLKCHLIAKRLQLLSSYFVFATMKTEQVSGRFYAPLLCSLQGKFKRQSLLDTAAAFNTRASCVFLVPLVSPGQTDKPTDWTPWDVHQALAQPWGHLDFPAGLLPK